MRRPAVGARPEARPAHPQEMRHGQHEPGEEAADMGPIGDAAGEARLGAADHLQPEPDAQHDPGGDGENPEEDDEDDQHIDAGAREHQQIAAHHPGDCARGADHRDRAGRVDGDLRAGRREPREQIEGEEAEGAELVLEIVAKNPQEQHVAAHMHQARVQEHMGEKAPHPRTLRHRRGIKCARLPQPLHVAAPGRGQQIEEEVDRDQAPGDPGRAQRGVVVADREHGARVSDPPRAVKRARSLHRADQHLARGIGELERVARHLRVLGEADRRVEGAFDLFGRAEAGHPGAGERADLELAVMRADPARIAVAARGTGDHPILGAGDGDADARGHRGAGDLGHVPLDAHAQQFERVGGGLVLAGGKREAGEGGQHQAAHGGPPVMCRAQWPRGRAPATRFTKACQKVGGVFTQITTVRPSAAFAQACGRRLSK
ncbi:hypothetical protein SDC9_16960 [bioreactor metagenome]|uniref:Uncharacterized protein n=1 Tax=bioreactor metagenome TaxID=1076179 RepID=A0A644TXK9_9ZZZZ